MLRMYTMGISLEQRIVKISAMNNEINKRDILLVGLIDSSNSLHIHQGKKPMFIKSALSVLPVMKNIYLIADKNSYLSCFWL